MWVIQNERRAEKALKRLAPEVRERIRSKILALAENPYASHLDVKKLVDYPAYRLRIGDWRVIYELKNNHMIILVVDVGHRREVYN